ncbi:MAG: PKD domain-containing protein [Marinilabiliales bacterium]|nr:PKD domain-containing protein [Marinilabiliales bacterium]
MAGSGTSGDPGSGSNNISTPAEPNPYLFPRQGNYSVTLTVTNFSGGCADDTLMVITVTPAPQAMFSYSGSCQKDSTQFTDLSIAPNSMLTAWLWNFGDGNLPPSAVPESDPMPTSSASGTYMVTLLVTNLNNCTDSIPTLPVEIHQAPNAAFTFTTFFCRARQVQIRRCLHRSGIHYCRPPVDLRNRAIHSNLPNPVYVFPVTDTTYTVSLEVTGSYGLQGYYLPGCRRTNRDFTRSSDYAYDTVCFGTPTHFTPQNIAPGDSLYWVIWNFGDPASGANNISNEFSPDHTSMRRPAPLP